MTSEENNKDIEVYKNRIRVLENLNFKYREKLGISNEPIDPLGLVSPLDGVPQITDEAQREKPAFNPEVVNHQQDRDDYLDAIIENRKRASEQPNDVGEVARPKVKDFFPESFGVMDILPIYQKQPELFNYAKALDLHIDELESHQQNAKEVLDEMASFILKTRCYGHNESFNEANELLEKYNKL